MNKRIVLGAALLVAGASQAALIASDSFDIPDYTAGQLQGQNPTISGMTGEWLNGNNAEVMAAGLTYSDASYTGASGGSVMVPDANDSGGRQGRLLSTAYNAASTDTVYLSFLMQTGTDEVNSYRAFELHDGGFSDNPNRKFQLGFQNGDFASAGVNYGFKVNGTSTALGANTGDVALFVLKFDFSDAALSDSVTVWQNPDLATPGAGTTVSGFDMSFDRITFAKYGASGDVSWDELRVGDTFTDVIPEPATLGLLSVFGGGVLIIRRRFMI